jgi:perosamine synthetase
MNLIPVEHWEYGISDLIYGIAKASRKSFHHKIILPELGNCFTIGSGRAGLVIALYALKVKPGARIGVPLYCCPVVLKAIEFADCRPQFIDIDPDTFCISAQDLVNKIDRIDALIAVHMFGNMCDMRVLRSIAKDKPIIEDCAQALGSRIDDTVAGLLGDIAFFSFRSGKYLSTGEGGAVFSIHDEFRDRIEKLIKTLQNISYRDEILHAFKTYIRSKLRSKPLFGLVGHRLWTYYNKTTEYSTKASISMINIYKSDRVIAETRLNSIDAAIAKQRDNAHFFDHTLKLKEGMKCPDKPGTYYNRYLYPILFASSKQRDLMSEYMYKQGIGTIKPYHDIPRIAAKYHEYKGDCPFSEKIAERILVIPNHFKLTQQELQHIVLCFNKNWATIRNK